MLALYTVILLPLREMPALSEQLKILPYEAPDRSLPLFVVADQHGRQTGAATGRQAARFLQIPMARTLVASLEDRPRPDDLHRAYRAIRRVNCQFNAGTLTLTGHLPTYHYKQLAQAAVVEMQGVQQIVNDIKVGED